MNTNIIYFLAIFLGCLCVYVCLSRKSKNFEGINTGTVSELLQALLRPFGRKLRKRPFIASLSTSPQRLRYVQPRINDNLTKQTVKPDFVYLNLPLRFNRTDELYNENEINELRKAFGNKIKILRPPDDLGPATKILPSILEEKQKGRRSLIVSIDDDIQYPDDLFERLLKSYKDKDSVISNSCFQMEEGLGILEGFSGVLYDTDSFEDDVMNFINKAIKHDKCYTADDYVLTRYLKSKRIVVKPMENKVYDVHPLDYGLQKDALHVIDDSSDPNTRYKSCKNFMDFHM